MSLRYRIALVLVLLSLLAGGCSAPLEAQPSAVPVQSPTPAPTAESTSTPSPSPTATPSPTPEPSPIPEQLALYEQNSDFFMTIQIPDTKIDYPVMYAPQKYDSPDSKSPEYYLYKDFDESYRYAGSIFLDSHNAPSDRNIYLWGHNMRDGSMFRALQYYGDRTQSVEEARQFWQEHRYVTLTDLYRSYTYEIFASFHGEVNQKLDYMFWFHNANTEEEFTEYIAYIEQNRFFDTGVTAEWGDKLLTLVTCYQSDTDDKMVVVAKRVDGDQASSVQSAEGLIPLGSSAASATPAPSAAPKATAARTPKASATVTPSPSPEITPEPETEIIFEELNKP